MSEIPQLLKRMIVSAINAREVESARASRLLHDEVGQVLSAVGLQMEVLRLDFQSQVPEIASRIKEIQEMLDQAVRQVRSLSYDLNPSVVERAGLQSALDRLLGRFGNRFNGKIRLNYDLTERIPVEVANIWYKIAELALDNSVQHAQASHIEVNIKQTAREFVMEVRDDGSGFPHDIVAAASPGLGLLMMEHYAAQSSVELNVRSKPGRGTTVRCTWNPARGDSSSGNPARNGTEKEAF